MRMYLSFIVMTMGCLSACSVFSPVKVDNPTSYVINTIPPIAKKKSSSMMSLLIAAPSANRLYDTTQMAYTIRPHEINYFVKNRWADTPADMLQAVVAETIRNTGYFRTVGVSPAIGYYHYVLNMQLLELQQVFEQGRSFIRMRVRGELINTATSRVIDARLFSVSKEAAQNTPYAGVLAANAAAAEVARELALFCEKK